MQLPIWLLISSGSFKQVFVLYAISYGIEWRIFFVFCFLRCPQLEEPVFSGQPPLPWVTA